MISYIQKIDIVINPISSLYDILEHERSSAALKALYSDYKQFIDIKYNKYTIKKVEELTKAAGNKAKSILNDIHKFNLDNYIKDTSNVKNYLILPYNGAFLESAYPTSYNSIKNKTIKFEYEKDINLIKQEIFEQLDSIILPNKESNMKIIFNVPMFDKNIIEYRFQKEKANIKTIEYKKLFDEEFRKYVSNMQNVRNIEIKTIIQQPIEDVFENIKKRDKEIITPYLGLIQFFQTLYLYNRNKEVRQNILKKSSFHKAILLYSIDFLDKDITELNKEYYYELKNAYIHKKYISDITNETIQTYLADENPYISSRYKIGDHYRCIGRIYKIVANRYKFIVSLRQLLFEDIYVIDDTISINIFIDNTMFGLRHTYYVDNTEDRDIIFDSNRGKISIFNENDIKILKYNNIDKSSSDNNELFISKKYRMESKSFVEFLKRKKIKYSAEEFLKYFKSPTELQKYEIFIQEEYFKLKYKKEKTLSNRLIENKVDYKSLLEILFKENTTFNLKPRKNSVVSTNPYKLKLDKQISIYEIDTKSKDLKAVYDKALTAIFNTKKLQKKYIDVIHNKEPNYIIYVNLLLQKKDFKESSFDCNEIKYKLKKYTKRLLSGGSKKLKTKNKIHNKRCISKQCLERYSRRKI